MTPSMLLLPLPMSEPARTVCLKYAYVFLRPLRPKHLTPDYKAAFCFLSFRALRLVRWQNPLSERESLFVEGDE
jgi:hypothetical protein